MIPRSVRYRARDGALRRSSLHRWRVRSRGRRSRARPRAGGQRLGRATLPRGTGWSGSAPGAPTSASRRIASIPSRHISVRRYASVPSMVLPSGSVAGECRAFRCGRPAFGVTGVPDERVDQGAVHGDRRVVLDVSVRRGTTRSNAARFRAGRSPRRGS